jgi:CheY-like chemotaxis protein
VSQERRRSGRRSTDRAGQLVDSDPLEAAVGDRPETFGNTPRSPSRRVARTLRGTVLLVDADSKRLAALSRSLLGSDYRVIRAAGAAEAIQVLGQGPVDVIIAELEMEDVGGLELLGLARARQPEAIRIALTSHPDVGSAVAAINGEEVFRYLTRPVTRDQLLATVHLALERRWRAPAFGVDAPPQATRPAHGGHGGHHRFEPEPLPALPPWLPEPSGAAGT